MSDDDDSIIKEKIYSTPEAKEKTRSKFKNILDDLELKMQKPKSFIKKTEQDSTNSKLDTSISNSISNNKNSVKDSKNKTRSIINNKSDNNLKINNTKQNPKIRRFNSFEEGSLKNGNNKGNTNTKKSNTNESIDKNRTYNEKNKTKKFIKINNINAPTSGAKLAGNLSVKLNHDNRFKRNDLIITKKNYNNSNNSKKKKEKLRPSTPGIRTTTNPNENISNNKNKNNNNNINNNNINNNDINQKNPNINNINNKEKKNIQAQKPIDPLYIPHIVKDPLDILRHQVDLILEQSNEDITNLSNSICLIDMEMESSYAKVHDNYAKELQEIYKEKETKLRETNQKYDFALYKMFKTYGHENNIIYDEMMKDKVEQILEVEQEFNAKKNQIKNNFNTKIEEIKKTYEKKRKDQEMINSKMIKDIKNKIYAILYEDSKKKDNNKDNFIDNKKSRRKKAISMNKK